MQLYVNDNGYIFEIRQESFNYLMVTWRDDISYFSNAKVDRPKKSIVRKADMGNYQPINSYEEYRDLFAPVLSLSAAEIKQREDERRFKELMSRFNEEEREFLIKHVSWMMAPRA